MLSDSRTRRVRPRAVLSTSAILLAAGHCAGQIIATATPPGLDALMGTPLFAVPADGMAPGTLYGHAPSAIPGIALPTPIGPMGFGPQHERLTPGTPTSSGSFLATTLMGPLAGSTVFTPAGTTAIDFFIESVGPPHTFEITAVGSATSATIILPAVTTATYVGFGAFGETIDLISIVKLPFPSPTTVTWVSSDIRVLPAPGPAAALLAGALGLVARRRR